MSRWSGVLVAMSMLMLGCVDTAEPTGPVPTPPGDEGELTSAVVTEAGVEEPGGPGPTRPRSGAPR